MSRSLAFDTSKDSRALLIIPLRKFLITTSNDRCKYGRGFATINKAVHVAVCNFTLAPRGAQPVISGRRLILKPIYPVANFIAAHTPAEEAIIRGSSVSAKGSLSKRRDCVAICIPVLVPALLKKYVMDRARARRADANIISRMVAHSLCLSLLQSGRGTFLIFLLKQRSRPLKLLSSNVATSFLRKATTSCRARYTRITTVWFVGWISIGCQSRYQEASHASGSLLKWRHYSGGYWTLHRR